MLLNVWMYILIMFPLALNAKGVFCASVQAAGDDWVQTSPPRKADSRRTKATDEVNEFPSPLQSPCFAAILKKKTFEGLFLSPLHSLHCIHTFFFLFLYLAEWGFPYYNLAGKLLGDRLPAIRRHWGHSEWQKCYYLGLFKELQVFKLPANEWINSTKANDVSLRLNRRSRRENSKSNSSGAVSSRGREWRVNKTERKEAFTILNGH